MKPSVNYEKQMSILIGKIQKLKTQQMLILLAQMPVKSKRVQKLESALCLQLGRKLAADIVMIDIIDELEACINV